MRTHRNLKFCKATFLLVFMILFATTVHADKPSVAAESSVNLQIESLKASIAEIKENQVNLASKQDKSNQIMIESDKVAFEALTLAKTTNETQKSIWIPILSTLITALATLVAASYFFAAWLAKRSASSFFEKMMPKMLEEYLNTNEGKVYLTDKMTDIAQKEASKAADTAVQQLSGAMLAATFHNSGRQDLLETMLTDLKSNLPNQKENLSRHELQLLAHSYRDNPNKYQCVLELAEKALLDYPDDSEVLGAKGLILSRMKNYEEALPLLRKAVENAPLGRSKCVHQWTLAFCIQKHTDISLIPEGIHAAREALVQLSHNQSVKMTLINCLASSGSPADLQEGLSLAKGLLTKCNNDRDPVKAHNIWRGIKTELQKELDPSHFGFKQLIA